VITGDMGVAKDGSHKDMYQPGMELRAKYTLIGEGARGSLSKKLIEKFGLSEGREPQKFGIGMKELWRIKPENFKKGRVQHTMGWPLDLETGGGSFLYHFGDNLVVGRLCGAPELQKPAPLPVRRVPAVQDPSRHRADL
jgi:electron-transferring-flavoprotein dehydrogenase